ncbi:hypothetical protein N9L02_01030 [Gammaproteobacteria bacterium]|nr:hypothetical protein [Gammaproteobacteria bacterium]
MPVYGLLDTRLQLAVKLGILTHDEMVAFKDYDVLYQDIIQVNEFTFNLKNIVK